MAKQYFSIITQYGSQVLANAIAKKQPLRITQMAVGDGNGATVTPTATQTKLVHEVHRANISAVSLDPRNNKQVIFELSLPESVGGFYIREMGIFDDQNKLVAVANCPESFKPTLESGSGKVQVLRMILQVSSSNAVTLSVDDTVIFVTRGQFTPKTITANTTNGYDDTGHSHDIDEASTTQKGIVQLTNDTGLDSEVLGLTARAGKKLAQLIASIQVALGNYIQNSKKSSAVNSSSEDTVATSKAVKTAYDKGVEAKTAADNANTNANGRVSKSGDTITGVLRVNAANLINGAWSAIQFGSNGGVWQYEFNPNPADTDNRRFNVLHIKNGVNTYLNFPHFVNGDVVAYRSWVDSRIQGVINAAPSNLDTLKELSDALGGDANFSRTVLNKIAENKQLANDANNNANGRVSKSGDTMTGKLTLPTVEITSNGKGDNIKVGDDAYLGDINRANTISVKGVNDATQGYFSFGNSGKAFGWNGSELVFDSYPVHYSGLSYVKVTADRRGYGGIEINSRNGVFKIETEGNHFKLSKENGYNIVTPERDGEMALKAEVVDKSGDTMTGDLVISSNNGGGHGKGIKLINKGGGTNTASHIDYRTSQDVYPQAGLHFVDRGGYSVGAAILTTPTGNTYNQDRRETHTRFDPDGNLWVKNYGFLHDKFHHSEKDYVYTKTTGNYCGLGMRSAFGHFRVECNGNVFKLWKENSYSIFFPEKGGTVALTDDIENQFKALPNRVIRRDYSKTIKGTSTWDSGTSKNITVTGYTIVYPDGKIEQIIHLKNFRVRWFAEEDAPTKGLYEKGIEIPIGLWTAMPNKITGTMAIFSRCSANNAGTTHDEATEWVTPRWQIYKQQALKDKVYFCTRRWKGDVDEPIDMYIKVEGY